jgi:hypothetical protein
MKAKGWEDLKEEGDNAFRSGNHRRAVQLYSAALDATAEYARPPRPSGQRS